MSDNNVSILNFQKSVNASELLFIMIKRWYIIIASIVICFLVALIHATVFVTPLYASTAKIIVFNKQETTNANDLELSSSLYLAKDFKEIIVDKMILNDVSAELGGKYNIAQLKSYIEIENPQNTRIIAVTAMSPDPDDSKKIVDTICNVSQEKLVELMGLDRITLISNGDVATSPAHPNIPRNSLIGILAGLLIGCLIIFIMYLMDNKIKSAEDIEKNFDISVLATIPFNNKQKTKKY